VTAREALARAAARLRLAGVDDPAREARILLEHALLEHLPELSRASLLARPDLPLVAPATAGYDALVARRARREPLPYILGHWPFRQLDLLVDARALIPRPETELLVELALDLTPCPPSLQGRALQGRALQGRGDDEGEGPVASRFRRDQPRAGEGRAQSAAQSPSAPSGQAVDSSCSSPSGKGVRGLGPTRLGLSAADIGTGSGAIAISLALEAPGLRVYATDLSADALALAEENARRHGVADRVTFLLGDLLDALPDPLSDPSAEQLDLIVANLPYVATADLATQPELGWEPRLALDGGADGLDACRRLLAQVPRCLRPGGRVLLEIGAAQGEAAATLAQAAFPGGEVRLHRDLAGLDRVVEVRA
jgi:release factor glutamine methyltransferase